MFVIACKFQKERNFIYQLVDDIRKFHSEEKIVIVDSDSEDKSYFELKDIYPNVEILDVKNLNYHVGAYWIAYNHFPDEDFYYFLHDSVRVKANLDFLKEKDFTNFAYFPYSYSGGNNESLSSNEILTKTPYSIPSSGLAIQGPMFFVKNKMMKIFKAKGVDTILPTYSEYSVSKVGVACYSMEGAYGIFFENEGYSVGENSLIGDYLSHGYPQFIDNYDSSWMFPIEKLLAKRQ